MYGYGIHTRIYPEVHNILPHNFGSRTLGWALSLDNICTATHTYPQTSKKQFPLLFNHQLAKRNSTYRLIEVPCLALKLLAW